MPFPTVQKHTSVAGLPTGISEFSSPVFLKMNFLCIFFFCLWYALLSSASAPGQPRRSWRGFLCLTGVKIPISQAL